MKSNVKCKEIKYEEKNIDCLQKTLKVAYYSFYEARARATIRLPDVNIARARKTFVSNTKENENKFEPFLRTLTVSESFRRF